MKIPNIYFTKFEYTPGCVMPKNNTAEGAVDILLSPLRNIFGYTLIKTDGNKILKSTVIIAEKVHRAAAIIFSILLFPISALMTFTGLFVVHGLESQRSLYNKLFKTKSANSSPEQLNKDKESQPTNSETSKKQKDKKPSQLNGNQSSGTSVNTGSKTNNLETNEKQKPKKPSQPIDNHSSAASHNTESKTNHSETSEKMDQLEKTFWEDQFKNKDLFRFVEMIIRDNFDDIKHNNIEQINLISELWVENYLIKKFGRELANLNGTKNYLKKSIVKQIQGLPLPKLNSNSPNSSSEGVRYEDIAVSASDANPQGGTLRVFRTKGEGSCGFHALLGEPQNGRYRCDAPSERPRFCQYLRDRWAQNQLTQQIENVLKLYFDDACKNKIPPFLKTNTLLNTTKQFLVDYDSLSNEEKDQRFNAFIRNKDIFDAYLNYMENIGTYLTQDELEAVAICFNKTIRLYQPGWGNDSDHVDMGELNPGCEIVDIFYNGVNHYERAQFFAHQA